MKSILSFVLMLTTIFVSAQPLRIHLMGGFANYSGDLQEKNFTLNQANGVIAAGATYHLTEKLALRSEYSFAKISADDKLSETNKARNLNFTSIIRDINLMAEYDIFNLNDRRFSPYIFGGIGVFKFSPYTYNNSGGKVHLHALRTEGQETSEHPNRKHYKQTQLNLPVGGGIKYALSDDVHVGLELGFRKLFTDYLDDVSTTIADETILHNEVGYASVQFAHRGDELKDSPRPYPSAGSQRGSPKYKDSYYFGQLRISFRLSWFGEEGRYGYNRKNRMGCPTSIY